MMDEEIQQQIEALIARVNELEQRVANLENNSSHRVASVSSSSGSSATTEGSVDASGLVEAIKVALGQIGEADAGAIRQQLVKNGQPNSITRSDVNKALYRNTTVFAVARQEGMKPFWKLA